MEARTNVGRGIKMSSFGKSSVSLEECINALVASKGLISEAAKRLGRSYSGLYKRIQNNDELRLVAKEIEQANLDSAEHTVLKLISEKDNLTAAMYYLNNKGASRGYSPQLKLGGIKDAPFEMETKQTINISKASLSRLSDDQLDQLHDILTEIDVPPNQSF